MKIFHEHDVPACPIYLRVNQPSSVGGNTETRAEPFIDGDDLRQLARREVEELDHRASGRLGAGEINALIHHLPGALKPGSMRSEHWCLLAAHDWDSPNARDATAFRIIEELSVGRLEAL